MSLLPTAELDRPSGDLRDFSDVTLAYSWVINQGNPEWQLVNLRLAAGGHTGGYPGNQQGCTALGNNNCRRTNLSITFSEGLQQWLYFVYTCF